MMIDCGTRVSHYEILSRLGAGGMGEVYLAQDTSLDRKVALKILPVSLVNDEDRLRRLAQEALATSALNHPNILIVYDIGTREDAPYILKPERWPALPNHGRDRKSSCAVGSTSC
jgi:serine/threonine-protein kinase